MEDIKLQITNLLNDKKARDLIEIIEYLNYPKEKDEEIVSIINKMVDECDLYLTKHNRYMNFKDSDLSKNLYKGTFQMAAKGDYGFLIVPGMDEDIFISASNRNTALNDDLVLVNVIKEKTRDTKAEGRIVKILKRNVRTKVGMIEIKNNEYYCILNNKNADKVLLTGDVKGLVDGDIVTLEILNEGNKRYPRGRFVKRLGHKNEPGMDIICVLAEHDFDVKFPDDVELELKNIETEVSDTDLVGRRDLRDELIFTIDGDDTKDIDDAISYKKLDNGNHLLGVHIADVSHYVKEGSALDKEARKRGTSVYLADTVVPMLPPRLSNGICSLNPNVSRLAISCVMEINSKGEFVNYEIFPSVIKSRKQMTYNNVNSILENGIVPDDYKEYQSKLIEMCEFAKMIRENKIKKGYIDFDIDESKIIVDENANVIDIQKRYRGLGEKLIEDFMILANEAVASYISNADLPGIYRVHGDVNTDRLRKYLRVLNVLGVRIKTNINNINNKTIQEIIKSIKDLESFQVLSTLMLSCMDKAKYDTKNIGHFALGLKNYTHFTSPIRRYPDTTTHRLLREYFFMEDGFTVEKINHFENILDDICERSSERERASIDCEREVDKMKMAEYMEGHIGEEFEGMVSGITSFGIYVILPDKLIEGMIRLSDMDDFYEYDTENEMLVGRDSGRIITIGTKLNIKVINASKETRNIDFIEVLNEEKKKGKKIKKKY